MILINFLVIIETL